MAKSSKKAVVVKARKPNPLHEKLAKLFLRPTGATLTDIQEAGWKYSAMAALKTIERHGLKTSVSKKVPGELTRYIAKRASQ
jgi:hypothetical protein